VIEAVPAPEGDDWYDHAIKLCPIEGCGWQFTIEKRRRGDSFDWWVMHPLEQEGTITEHLHTHLKSELLDFAAKSKPRIREILEERDLL
jgi:hypothetical protein